VIAALPIRRTRRSRWLRCLLTHRSALRELLATEAASHDASKPICHFWLSLEACWGLRNCAELDVYVELLTAQTGPLNSLCSAFAFEQCGP
jgi:hypothetical protein